VTSSKKTKAKVKMIEMGIVPAFTGLELTEMLNSLSEEERRKAKRKFRKQWRRISKSDLKLRDLLESDGDPDKHTLRNRSSIVVCDIVNMFEDLD
tara:strand:+ start:875 stop:1159 length:285 start_codon:yes stop_codon:yes gene_type:complete